MLRERGLFHQFAGLLHIAFQSVEPKIFLQCHAVLDGKYLIIVVVDAMVEDGLDNQVFTGLGVEKQGVEFLEDVLHRKGHVTVTARQVKVVFDIRI